MLKQHLKTFGAKSAGVKTAAVLTLLFAATPMIAHSGNIVTKTYSVKFEKSLTESEAGIQKVYKLIENKAAKACRLDYGVDSAGNPMSRRECVANMVEQLVESANIEAVKAYHTAQTTTG